MHHVSNGHVVQDGPMLDHKPDEAYHDDHLSSVAMAVKTTDIEHLGTWCEVAGREGERLHEFRPLADLLSMHIAIKNTGTTTIDHFTWQQTVSIGHMKMELLHPRVPTQLWHPFAGNLLSSSFRRQVNIQGDRLEVINPDLHSHVEAVSLEPIGEEGIRPGETLTVVEERKLYMRFLEEGAQMKGAEMGVNLRMEIVDKEKGILDMVIEEFKFGPITFHDMRLQIVMKGKVTTLQEVLIDGKLRGSKEVQFEYL
jgi:hypothetical protein